MRVLLALAALLIAPAAAQASAPTADQIVARAEALGVGDQAQRLRDRFLPGFRLLGGGTAAAGATRIGGAPDLARGVRWPRCRGHALSFLMQVRLADIGAGDGTLAVFADLTEDDDGVTRIEYFSGPVRRNGCVTVRVGKGTLARRAPPRRTKTLRNVPVRLRPVLTVPGWETTEGLLGLRPGSLPDAWFELQDEAQWGVLGAEPPSRPVHQLLGWASPIQGDPASYCGRAKRSDRLLLQLDDDEKARFDIGDAGALYLTIPPQDLAHHRFDRLCGEFQEG